MKLNLHKSRTFGSGITHPAAILQQSVNNWSRSPADDDLQSESTADFYNFTVDDQAFVIGGKLGMTAPRPILFAEKRRAADKAKSKAIDRLLKAEVIRQDREYRAERHQPQDIFDDKSQDVHNEDKKFVNPTGLKTRIQTEFVFRKTPMTSNLKSARKPVTEYSELGQTQTGRMTEQSYSKKFRLVTIDSQSRLKARPNTDRPQPTTGETETRAEDSVGLRKMFAGDVVNSLQSGKSLNLDKYIPRKTESKATLELFLDVRSKEAQISSKQVRKNSRPAAIEVATSRTRFQPSNTVSHLPANLRFGMTTFNDFYRSDKEAGENDNSMSFDGLPVPVVEEQEKTVERQTLTYMIRAVKKVSQATSVLKAFRDVERARLRERVEARKAEMSRYNEVLNKLEFMVTEKEKELTEAERQARLKEALEKRKLMQQRLEAEQRKLEQRRLKELSSQISPKLFDRFSVKKVTSIKPYKSYWLKCIDTCLESYSLFKDSSKSDVDLKLVSDSKVVEVGYYRVVLQQKAKGSAYGADPSVFFARFEQYTEYKFQEDSQQGYDFEFDGLLDVLEEEVEQAQPSLTNLSPQSSSDPKKLHKTTAKKKQKAFEEFAAMFVHIDEDITREYSLLFPDY